MRLKTMVHVKGNAKKKTETKLNNIKPSGRVVESDCE